MKKTLLLKFVFIMMAFVGFALNTTAQVTTSSMTGTIRDAKGVLPGASVRATHTPSGSVYTVSTGNDGRFTISNMRVGGPYSIKVSYIGYDAKTAEGIYLKLGESFNAVYALDDAGTSLSEVSVRGVKSKINQQKTGASTNISNREIAALPTISRSITDFTRLTPQANGNSFGGRDGRSNNLQVDGANLNNNFGLSNDPLPGGGAQPISLDAYDQISVNIAPYDVRQSGFTGAGISAVTKSGTNTFHGSVYGYYRDQSFLGTKVGDNDIKSTIQDSKSKTYGFTLGGPIIKDKLFFFVNAEKETSFKPGMNFYPAGTDGAGTVSSTTKSDLDVVSNYLKTNFGYDPGTYSNFPPYQNENHKILAKLDWNINNAHKLTVKYSELKAVEDVTTNASSIPNNGGFKATNGTFTNGVANYTSTFSRLPQNRFGNKSFGFSNSIYGFDNTTRSGTLELNSKISNNFSNQLLLAVTKNQSTRYYPGQLFPTIDIFDGKGNNFITAGMDPYTYNNDVVNDVYSFTNNMTYYAGKHTFTGGVTYEYQKTGNMYMPGANSYYVFNSLNDFITNQSPIYFSQTTSLVAGKSAVYSAELKLGQAGAYIQDEWNANDNWKMTFGVRADMPIYHEDPLNNPATSALSFYSSDNVTLRNYNTSKWSKNAVMLSPRFGFRYTTDSKSTIVRGGLGVFTGKIPLVFLTNIPTNTAMYQYGGTFNNNSAAGIAALNGIKFSSDVNAYSNLFNFTPGTKPNSNVVFMDNNFKFPKVLRANLGIDQSLGNGFTATFDGIFSKDINAVYMRNANQLLDNGVIYEGNLSRPRISGATNKLNSDINSAIVLENSVKGYSSSLTAQLSKASTNNGKGLTGSIAYTYTAAKEITANPGSQASSVWNSNPLVGTANSIELSNSAYAIPHRVVGHLSYRVEYLKHLATTISLFYEGAHQGVMSYVVNGDMNGDGNSSTDLMYIPRPGETKFQSYNYTSGGQTTTFSVAEQEAALNTFIENSPYLSKNRGSFAKRNAALLPWFNRVDFKLLQDIYVNTGKNGRQTLQFSADILNFSNLLNKNWGTYSRSVMNNPLTFKSIGADNRPTYTMQNISGKLVKDPFQDNISVTSTYSIMLGLRYIF